MFHFVLEEPRARRRRVSLTLAHRRRAEFVTRRLGIGQPPNIREVADTYFAKTSPYACGCSKRKKGQPKVACGMCEIGRRDRIVHWRQEARAVRAGLGEEVPERSWPSKAKHEPKSFVVERRDMLRDGSPAGEWYPYRKYRSEQARCNAADALRKGTTTYAAWAGPRHEYR